MIHWLVLTGGASSRFGQDKATTEMGGRSLLDRAVDVLHSLDPVAPITVVGPEKPGGPAAAVVSTLAEVQTEFIGVLAVDMPFAADALSAVTTAVRDHAGLRGAHHDRIDAWVPEDSTGRRQWLCAVYRKESLQAAAAAQARWSAAPFHRLVGDLPTFVVPVPLSVSLLDIDTPEDFQRALDVARELGS